MKNTIPAKILTFTLAAVLGMPQVAFAARDGEGMQYTSASEGFYGSIRTVYRSQKTDGDGNNAESGPSIGADLSRLGVRGSLDLGGGLTGVYRYEWQINGDNGDAVGNTRLSFVGLRGEWGSFVAGSHWAQDYNWVSAATDIASTGSGNFAPTFRVKNSFEYTTPDVGGLQGAFRFRMDGESRQNTGKSYVAAAGSQPEQLATPDTGSKNLDEWAVSGKYQIQNFTIGGVYQIQPDGARLNVPVYQVSVNADMTMTLTTAAQGTITFAKDDDTFWAARLGYGRDNWGINVWYGEHNTSETIAPRNATMAVIPAGMTVVNEVRLQGGEKPDNTSIFSIAGNMDAGKFALIGIYESRNNQWGEEDTAIILNVDYNFTSQSKAYIAYIANDYDSAPNLEDEVRIGLRMDF